MSNIIIYVSSRNNYDMLSGEVLKNINTEGFEFINVDLIQPSKQHKKIKYDNTNIYLINN